MKNSIIRFLIGLISAFLALSASSALVFPVYADDSISETVVILPGYLDLFPDGSYQLTADVSAAGEDGTPIVWSSSDPSVAAVDENGLVTAVSGGEAIITASIGAAVADCIVDVENEAVEYNYSEWNMATNVSRFAKDGLGFDWDATTGGGNYLIASAYLARWDGAVAEDEDPYPKFVEDPTGMYQEDLYKKAAAAQHVQDIEWIPPKKNALDNNEIKAAVTKYGAVYTLMNNEYDHFTHDYLNYYYDDYIDPDDYRNNPENYPGHAVSVVGWDDNYPSSNFDVTPPGNGAFICRNSWGTWVGDNGYFYVSYYDQRLCRFDFNAVVTGVSDTASYNTVYQYDPFGPLGFINYIDMIYISNVFPEQGRTLDRDEELNAVSFYTYNKRTPYEVYVITDYKNSDSFSKLPAPVAAGELNSIGYHTVELAQPITLSAGTRFAVVVKYSSDENNPAVFTEEPYDGYAPNANANSDESYMSYDSEYWYDLTGWIPGTNFCIKAFTYSSQVGSGTYQAIDNAGRKYDSNDVLTAAEMSERGTDTLYTAAEDVDKNSGTIAPFIFPSSSGGYSEADKMVFPSKFDLRALSLLSPIRNQDLWNTCWAHSICASLESYKLRLARSGGNTGTDPEQMELSRTSLTLSPDSSHTLSKEIFPLSAINVPVKWTSSNESVAVVDENGTVRALAPGTATIKAVTQICNISAECRIFVSGGTEITGTDASALQLSDNGTLSGRVTVTADTPAPIDVNAILTVRNEDGTLAGVRSKTVHLDSGTNTLSFDNIYIEGIKGIHRVKIMLWNSLDFMLPLTSAAEIK